MVPTFPLPPSGVKGRRAGTKDAAAKNAVDAPSTDNLTLQEDGALRVFLAYARSFATKRYSLGGTETARAADTMGIIHRLWFQAPILVRAVLNGSIVSIAGTVPWVLLVSANTRYLSALPWAVPVMAVYLWF